jgi:glycosyltransferase involved in cell wall biosynthesis
MIQFENFSVKTIFKKSRITNFFEKRYLFKRYSVNGGNHFIAISKDTYEFANKTCKNHEISILNNAIDINKFKRNTPIPFDKIRIINVGSFVKKKNQILFIKIAKILREKKIDFIITLVGYGPMLEDLRKLITKNNLDDFFQLTGMVENVNDYLNDSNIYIHSALYEPFGLVLLEAMACSLPVITLNGKGNRDFIEDGKNGFVIETESAELFVEKVVELWLNRNEYLFMSNYAKSFSKTYDINNYVEKLLDIYKKLLSSSKNSNRNFNKI